MYIISQDRVTERSNQQFILESDSLPVSRYPWKVEMFYKDGGLMKRWYIGANDNPITAISYTNAEKGCIDANLKLSKIDFPVYYGNEVIISYNNKKEYRGFISNIPNYAVPDTLRIQPFSKKLNEIIINTTYTDQTFKQMLSDILQNNSTKLYIYYNESMITDYTNANTYSPKLDYVTVQKFIDDYIDYVDDVSWGVEENGFVRIKTRSTSLKYTLYAGANQFFQKVTYKKDWDKIKNTRFHVFQKSTDTNETVFISTIPDGTTTYPYFDYENVVGIKESKLTAPQGLNSTECKLYAFGKLQAQKAPENIKVKGIDKRKLDLKVGDRVKVVNAVELQLDSLINCDSTVNWIGNVLVNTSQYVEGTGSIQFNSPQYVTYDYGEIQRFIKNKKIVFMIKSNDPGSHMEVSFSQNNSGQGIGYYGIGLYSITTSISVFDSWSTLTAQTINIRNVGVWNEVEIPVTYDFRYINIRRKTTSTINSTIYIDDIRLYGYQTNEYEGNVIKLDYDINKNNQYYYDAELGDYDPMINDNLFLLEQKIKILEENQQEI